MSHGGLGVSATSILRSVNKIIGFWRLFFPFLRHHLLIQIRYTVAEYQLTHAIAVVMGCCVGSSIWRVAAREPSTKLEGIRYAYRVTCAGCVIRC